MLFKTLSQLIYFFPNDSSAMSPEYSRTVVAIKNAFSLLYGEKQTGN